jgi:uncharacterized membrane protein YgcG
MTYQQRTNSGASRAHAQVTPNPLAGTGLLEGEFSEFSSRWYSVVGIAVSLNMLLNVVVPHLGPLAQLLLIGPAKTRVLLRLGKVVTQSQMDALYEGPDFHLDQRCPAVLSTVFVTMFYCSGCPILLPLCAAAMFTGFYVDKLLLFKLYRKPPQYNAALAHQMQRLMPWALVMHLGVAVWQYGTSPPESNPTLGLRPSLVGLDSLFGAASSGFSSGRGSGSGGGSGGSGSGGGGLNVSRTELHSELFGIQDPFAFLGEGKGLLPKIAKTNVLPAFLQLLAVAAMLLVQRTSGFGPFYRCYKAVLRAAGVVVRRCLEAAWLVCGGGMRAAGVGVTGRLERLAGKVGFKGSKKIHPNGREASAGTKPATAGGSVAGGAAAAAAGGALGGRGGEGSGGEGNTEGEAELPRAARRHKLPAPPLKVHDLVHRRRRFVASFTGEFFQPLNVYRPQSVLERLLWRASFSLERLPRRRAQALATACAAVPVIVWQGSGELAAGLLALAGMLAAAAAAALFALLCVWGDEGAGRGAGKAAGLSRAEDELGFRLEGQGPGADVFRVWPAEASASGGADRGDRGGGGDVFYRHGVACRAGQRLRTWQAMDGQHSYRGAASTRYGLAFSKLEAFVREVRAAVEPPPGTRLLVWWPDEEGWFPGVVQGYLEGGLVDVLYDDGDREQLLLAEEDWEVDK